MKLKLLIGAASAALAVSAAAMGYAQERQARAPMDRQAFEQRMQQHREQRLADLRQLLRLRADQEAAFQTFVAALRPQPRPRGEERGAAELTTPQLLARRAQRVALRKAEMDRRDQAVLAFYSALSPDQQKTFDAMVRLRGRRMFGGGDLADGRGWGHGRMGHGGPRDDGPPPMKG